MSRTYRNKRPNMKLGRLENRRYKNGKLRDGTPQYAAGSCHNHGGCPYCTNNRLHKHKRRNPIEY